MPEMGIEPVDPIAIEDKIYLSNSSSFTASAVNIKVYGLTNYKVHDLKIDQDQMKVDLINEYPHLRLEADYDVTARIGIPVSGVGPIRIYVSEYI